MGYATPLPVFRVNSPIVLASGSPRRHEFMDMLGLDFSVARPRAPEPDPLPGEAPDRFALRAARAKAQEIAPQHPQATIIAADTVVVLDGRVLFKPTGPDDALQMLQSLCGREHTVYTACCLLFRDGEEADFCPASTVRMGNWPPEVLRAYAGCREPDDKAGAYAVQGRGAFLIDAVNGSWTNIVGLPLAEVVGALVQRKVISPLNPEEQ